MDILFLLVIVIGLFFTARLIIRQNHELMEYMRKVDERLEDPPQRVIGSPNRLERLDPNVTFFDENNPMAIPKDVKFEIEGGDRRDPFSMN